MRKSIRVTLYKSLLLTALVAMTTMGVLRAEKKRASPHESVSMTVAGKKITIEYGRPYMKGRTIFGSLVPWDKVWRTGADEAAVLTTEGDITIGTLKVPKGTYSLFTIPSQKSWTLVVNKVAKQWGAFDYKPAQDLGRTPMTVTPNAAPVEEFTIELKDPGTLTMSWDKTTASVSISG
jgi:hypothetical protein